MEVLNFTDSVKCPVTILMVDDKPENLISLEALLAEEGRTFVKAESGNEALRIALKHDFAMVLLDVQMPEMDGFEVAGYLRKNPKTRHIPIVFITAIDSTGKHMNKGLESGAIDYLYKPLDPFITRKKVESLIEIYCYRKQLSDKNVQLEAALTDLENFSHKVAHDLKSPLRGLYHLAELIKEDVADSFGGKVPLNIEKYLGMMTDRTDKLSKMVTEILRYSIAGQKFAGAQRVDVKELIRDILAMVDPPEKMKIHVAETLPVLKVERIALQQVLQNILINSMKYNTASLPEVWVEARPPKGDLVHLVVRDNGPGIPNGSEEAIFKLNYRVAEYADTAEGTGIGLAVVKKVVEENGGNIWVDPSYDLGAAFHFTWKSRN